jgi:hypothetical protein
LPGQNQNYPGWRDTFLAQAKACQAYYYYATHYDRGQAYSYSPTMNEVHHQHNYENSGNGAG